MSFSQRLNKRSLVGRRVFARQLDGFLYPATVVSVQRSAGLETMPTYCVQFENGLALSLAGCDLIGRDFEPLTANKLGPHQPVFININGRQVPGQVLGHNDPDDDVMMCVDDDVMACGTDELVRVCVAEHHQPITVKIQDIQLERLQQSAERLQQPADGDDGDNNDDKRMIRQSDNVPINLSNKHRGANDSSVATSVDEHMAALALTSLSCSPVATQFSPPRGSVMLSRSAPTSSGLSVFKPHPHSPMSSIKSVQQVFKCMWPGCCKIYLTRHTVEKHIRSQHLHKRKEETSVDDHEEEFYYSEQEMTNDDHDDVMMNDDMSCQLSPVKSTLLTDHDYMALPPSLDMKAVPLSIPSSQQRQHHHHQQRHWHWATDVDQPTSQHCQHTVNTLSTSLPSSDVMSHITSAATVEAAGSVLRSRSDSVKKCRKVYGVENRALWCTQCKWKKACNRFNNSPQ